LSDGSIELSAISRRPRSRRSPLSRVQT